MSGHSHFATIKRQKAANDAARGNLFSKLARSIMIAAKSGADPDMNFKLRFEVEKARTAGLPKENIERAVAKATTEASNLEEITYEGFGPGGVAVMVETATDNKNRTAQEIKNVFDRGGGTLAGPGAVRHNFVQKGLLLVKKNDDPDTQMLTLIDMGVEDVADTDEGIEVYVDPSKLSEAHKQISDAFKVEGAELIMKPVNTVSLSSHEAERVDKLLDSMEELESVQKVFSNLNV